MNDEKKTLGEQIKPHIMDTEMTPLKTSIAARFRNYFLAGILVTAPLGITIYLVWIFLQFMDSLVKELLPKEYNPDLYLPFSVPGFGLLISILFFVFVGWFARNYFGRLIINLYEYVMNRVPVIRNIYGAIKQISETIMASQSQAFREVVLMEYPRKGVWSIGFVTNTSEGEIQRVTEGETVNVFVPTTPNPTSGYLLFVPKKDLYYLDMSVEEGVKMVVSAGIISPPDHGLEKLRDKQ
jgi:uncharacterized membrane protein